jgi:hypothetical protein
MLQLRNLTLLSVDTSSTRLLKMAHLLNVISVLDEHLPTGCIDTSGAAIVPDHAAIEPHPGGVFKVKTSRIPGFHTSGSIET